MYTENGKELKIVLAYIISTYSPNFAIASWADIRSLGCGGDYVFWAPLCYWRPLPFGLNSLHIVSVSAVYTSNTISFPLWVRVRADFCPTYTNILCEEVGLIGSFSKNAINRPVRQTQDVVRPPSRPHARPPHAPPPHAPHPHAP